MPSAHHSSQLWLESVDKLGKSVGRMWREHDATTDHDNLNRNTARVAGNPRQQTFMSRSDYGLSNDCFDQVL